MQKITLEEFDIIKHEFDEIYELIVADDEAMSFSDGTEYSEEEVLARLTRINDRLLEYDLSDVPAERFGNMIIFVTNISETFKGLGGTGANIDFSLLDEDYGYMELNDVTGCNLINIDFDKIKINDRAVDEGFIDAHKELFLERPVDINDPKNEALDRYYSRDMTIDDIILLKDELSDKSKNINWGKYEKIVEKLGVERFITLLKREPVYVESFIIDGFNASDYLDKVTENMSVDEIIDVWFDFTKTEIETGGIHSLTRSKYISLQSDMFDIDVSMYGERFLEAYPEFFVEDRGIPEEIKQKFYNRKLTMDEYLQYEEQFEGIMVGIGIDDKSGLRLEYGNKVFSELIRCDKKAIAFLQEYYDRNLIYMIIMEREDETIESFKETISKWLNGQRIAVWNNDIDVKEMLEQAFFRERLPDLFLDADAPDELKKAFYEKTLTLDVLSYNLDWLPWLEGKENYIKHCCIKNRAYREWAHNEVEHALPEELEAYMSRLYNSEIRVDRSKGNYLREGVVEGVFRENNPDMFFDDLPEELQELFLQRNMFFMEDFFALPQEQKEQLRGKEISMLLNSHSGAADFCRNVGGSFEDFEIYEKYEGILWAVIKEINRSGKFSEYQKFIDNNEVEELIKTVGLATIKENYYEYNDRVPEAFKAENREFFLDEDAPEELKSMFYRNGNKRMVFEDLQTYPTYIKYLEGKNIEHCFDKKYKGFFEFCGSQDIARELGTKYGDEVANIDYSSYDEIYYYNLTTEEKLRKLIYDSVERGIFGYRGRLPDDFRREYPELFLLEEDLEFLGQSINEDDLAFIKFDFYSKKITFDMLRKYPQLKEIMRNKNYKAAIVPDGEYLWDVFDGDVDKILAIAEEYGDILFNKFIKIRVEPNKAFFSGNEIIDSFDTFLHECILDRRVPERESMSDRFKRKFPEVFLLPEDLEKLSDIDHGRKIFIEERFYNGLIRFQDLKDSPEFREIIKRKNIYVSMLPNEMNFLQKFTELLDGDRDKAVNLASGRFASQLDGLLEHGIIDEGNIEKILAFYKEMKFIPHPAVVRKFPTDRVKDFALNSKLWGKLMSNPEYNFDDDSIGSMLEAAMIMGVFETKEFEKKGEVRVQGCGQEGFERLEKLLNHTLKYYRNPSELLKGSERVEFVGVGYIKDSPDCEDELIYEELEKIALEGDVLDELIQGDLTKDDVDFIIHQMSYDIGGDIEDYFVAKEDGTYRCKVDRNSNAKVKVLFQTLGIKDDSVLSEDEFRLVRSCDRDFISKAFVKTEEGYRFNMSQFGNDFVIGNHKDIDEKESRDNKRLFDYVKFLMMEYGLEAEGGRLTANNDRSSIDLVLDNAKMEKIANAADEICERAQKKYSHEELWLVKDEKLRKLFPSYILHQFFDGLEMVYSKEFSDFILENAEEIASNSSLMSKVNAMQKAVIAISQDHDYDEVKITPEVVLKAISDRKYLDKKTGFEKGAELAKKFAFTQEQFDFAQQIWDEARKRDASSIPRIEGQEDGYSYEVLRLDDATGIFIGNITNCCQKVGGAGETAMLHSMTEKNGRVFVVRDSNNKIIAQSWLWRNGDTICFDNVEIPNSANNRKNQEAAHEVLKKAARELCEKDRDVLDELVKEGKIDKEKAEQIRAKKVTVGKGNTDIDDIQYNKDNTIEDRECKFPVEQGKSYNNTTLYVSDSREQVVLYQDERYTINSDVPTLAIHRDDNTEKSAGLISRAELKTIEAMDSEIDSEAKENYENVNTVFDLADMYNVEVDELKLIMGTDWLVLYSENETDIKIHKMLRSPSSGILKKSVREQKEAVRVLMDRAMEEQKSISMDIENDKVYEATKTMIKHTKKAYRMSIEEEEEQGRHRIEISGVEGR